jgi:hypothetical protein
MCPQSCKNPSCCNFTTPTWESRDKKSHLDVALVERRKVYYMGEGDGFPRVRAVVSFVSPKSPMSLENELTNLRLVGCRSE